MKRNGATVVVTSLLLISSGCTSDGSNVAGGEIAVATVDTPEDAPEEIVTGSLVEYFDGRVELCPNRILDTAPPACPDGAVIEDVDWSTVPGVQTSVGVRSAFLLSITVRRSGGSLRYVSARPSDLSTTTEQA